MTSAAQPNPIDEFTADAELRSDALTEEAAEAATTETGGLPTDPDQAVHFRPGPDGPGGSMGDGSDR